MNKIYKLYAFDKWADRTTTHTAMPAPERAAPFREATLALMQGAKVIEVWYLADGEWMGAGEWATRAMPDAEAV